MKQIAEIVLKVYRRYAENKVKGSHRLFIINTLKTDWIKIYILIFKIAYRVIVQSFCNNCTTSAL
jgi:hypothetical protein